MIDKHSKVEKRVTLVTGANGFVGTVLCRRLLETGWPVRAVVRRAIADVDSFTVTSLTDIVPASPVFNDVGAVIHLAGRAHAPRLNASEQEKIFSADAEMTAQFAEAAALSGVRRFVFVSTAKVFGEKTAEGEWFSNERTPRPVDAYARYKLVAEDAVRDIAERHGMEWVVVRPVLVYGDDVKGNLATLLNWLNRGYVLPVGGLENRRSLLALDDLVELLRVCIEHPQVAGHHLPAAGDDTISTPAICRAMADGLGKRARLVRLPKWLWKALSRFPITAGKADRLAGSFVVDNSMTKAVTGWQPRVHAGEGLRRVAARYKQEHGKLQHD